MGRRNENEMVGWRRCHVTGVTMAMGLVVAGVATVPAQTAMALDPVTVVPTTVEGNPKCSDEDLFGFKIDGVPEIGRYDLPDLPGTYVDVVEVTSGGRLLDWASNFGIDHVIVKGGDAANVYLTDDARSGTDFTAPKNSSGGSARISHVEWCYDGLETPTITADTEQVAGARGVAIGDVPLAELPASLINLVAGADLVNDAGTGLRFSELVGDTDLDYAGTGLRFSGTGLRFSGTGLRFSGTGLRFSGTSIRFSGTGLRFSGTGLRFSGTGLRFSDSGVGTMVGIRSAGTGLRFSGTGLRFSGTGMRFSDLPGWDVPLSDLQPPEGYTWDDVFVALGQYQGYPPQNVTFGQLLDLLDQEFAAPAPDVIEALATMSLLDLDPNGAILRNVSLVGLLLGGTTLSDIPLPDGRQWCALIDPGNDGCSDDVSSDPTDPGAVIGDTTVLGLNLAGLRSDNIPLDEILLDDVSFDVDSVFADLLDDSGVAGDVYVPAAPGDSLATYLVRGIDALNVPWEQLPLATDFDVREYALGDRVTITSTWSQVSSFTTPISVSPSEDFELAAEGVECTVTSGSCVVTPVGADEFEVDVVDGVGIVDVTVTFAYRPSGLYDTASPPPPSGTLGVGVADASGSFDVEVFDPWAGQDPPPIRADVLYFASTGGADVDRYDVDVSEYAPGSHVAVRLSNLTDDADLVLYRSAGTGLRFSGTGMRFTGTGLRFSGTGLRFSGDADDSGVENLEPETLEDVRIDPDRLVEDVSANRASTPEAADGFTDTEVTSFEVQVSGFNEAATDYVVRVAVTEFADQCVGEAASASVSWGSATGADTAVLFAPGRFAGDDQQAISAALDRLAAAWPIVVGTVTTAGADWTTESGICSVNAANAVAEDVAASTQALAADNPSIEHVMIIGGDDKLPFYRTADTALIANEVSYTSTVGGLNPIASALSTQHVLTDDIYADDDPWPFLNRLYFTPDRGLGRLVESTADIVGQIDRFILSNGRIDVDRAFTAAYDFLSDVGVEIDLNLADVSSNRSTLISDLASGGVPDWTASQLASKLDGGDLGTSLSIASIEAHMDQGRLLTAFGDAQGSNVDPAEVVGPDDILPTGVEGTLMFTAGCHAGLSQPYPNADRTDDWAEALAGGPAAFYLANTGYGYGLDQPGIAYSEELLENFSELVELDGLTLGAAVAFAKQQFFASQLEIDPYDEKSQMQLTVYGVPMYSLTGAAAPAAPASAAAAAAGTTAVPDPVTGQPSSTVDLAPAFAPQTSADGTTYYGISSLVTDGSGVETGIEASSGDPLQPKMTFDVTADDPNLIARGSIIEQMASSQVGLPDPTIARAIVDNTATEQASESGTYIFPTAFTNVHVEQTPGGPAGKLVVVPAQYDSTDDGKEQLLIESMSVRTYYSSPPAPGEQLDVVRPQFRSVSGGTLGFDILFRVGLEDPAGTNVVATGVERVLVQYFDGIDWNPVELFPANAAGTEWSGGIPNGLALGNPDGDRQFFVQAVDGAGNVAVSANKGENYGIDGELALAVAFAEGERRDDGDGWFFAPPTVRVVGDVVVPGGDTHRISLDGGTPFFYDGPFVISDEGITEVSVSGEGAPPIVFDVKVDTRAPVVDLDQPIVVVNPGDEVVPSGLQECTDPTPGSGMRDLDPESASDCLLTSADYSLVLEESTTIGPFELADALGRDIAGNETTESQSAVILDGELGDNDIFTSTVILGIVGADADDALVGLDGADPAAYTDPIELTETTTVRVEVGDDALVFVVNIDTDAPVVSVVPAPAEVYELGELEQVTCSFADPAPAGQTGSGLASVQCGGVTGIDDPTIVTALDTSALGDDQTFVAGATDLAGNTTTIVFPYSVVDTTPPVVIIDPESDGPYEIGSNVSVTCSFADPAPGSGLDTVACGGDPVPGVASITVELDTSTLGQKTFEASAVDLSGNPAAVSFTYEVVDTIDPVVTVSPEPGGTYEIGTELDITCSFSDAGSGLQSVLCGGLAAGDVASLTVSLPTADLGLQSFTAQAVDNAGNTTTLVFSYTVVDTGGPTITVSPEPGGTYEIGEQVRIDCSFADPQPGSGLASIACGAASNPDVGGAASAELSTTLDTSSPGVRTFVATAVDRAGAAGGQPNTTIVTFTYEVIDPSCDPLGDVVNPDVDIVRCYQTSNPDGTATLSIVVDGNIAPAGVQYRLRLADDPTDSGRLVKWVDDKLTGAPLLDVNVFGDRIDFVVDPGRVGVSAGETLYWFAEVQDGVSGNPGEGFLDRAPDDGLGWFELVT